MSGREFQLTLEREEDYRFQVEFGHEGVAPLTVDEWPPIGGAAGPSPARLLATAVGHCLASSLLFCLQKARVPVQGMSVQVAGTVVRGEGGRLRVGGIGVTLRPGVESADQERMGRCLQVFEDFCTVTESVRQGLEVTVSVEPRAPAV